MEQKWRHNGCELSDLLGACSGNRVISNSKFGATTTGPMTHGQPDNLFTAKKARYIEDIEHAAHVSVSGKVK